MSGPHRNPDKLNTIGVVVVGICGAVLVYVSIVALQAFYMNDTADVQTMADYGGQETTFTSIRTKQDNDIRTYGPNAKPQAPKPGEAQKVQTYKIAIDRGMELAVRDAKVDAGKIIPSVGPSDKATVMPIFGRPKMFPAPATPAAPAAPTTPEQGAGSGSGSAAAPAAAGSGSAAGSGATENPQAPKAATGGGTGQQPVAGAGTMAAPGSHPAPIQPTPTPDVGQGHGSAANGNGR